MKIRQTEYGNMCEVRLKNRRIRVFRRHDKSWAVEFVRPTRACEGCAEDHSAMHRVYKGCKGKKIMTVMRLSREGMNAFCKAVATLLEFELNGVEVDV